MGILDLFAQSEPAKALKLRPKIVQKYGDPLVRQKAISQVGELECPEAVSVLLARFPVSVDPATIDAEEKDLTFRLVIAFGKSAVAPIKDFLFKTDQASSWAIRLLAELVPEAELVGCCIQLLEKIGPEYTRDPEKKIVAIHTLSERNDPRIAPALVPFLGDPADDVKMAALKALGPLKYELAREPLLELMTHPDTAQRVRTAAIAALYEGGFGVQGFREKVEALLTDPYFVDKSGLLKKRG